MSVNVHLSFQFKLSECSYLLHSWSRFWRNSPNTKRWKEPELSPVPVTPDFPPDCFTRPPEFISYPDPSSCSSSGFSFAAGTHSTSQVGFHVIDFQPLLLRTIQIHRKTDSPKGISWAVCNQGSQMDFMRLSVNMHAYWPNAYDS